ncbi:MAG: hypothetical protein U1A78_37725 [Polyangia bacterium]
MKTWTSLASWIGVLVWGLATFGTTAAQTLPPVPERSVATAAPEPPPAGFASDGEPLSPSVRGRHLPPGLPPPSGSPLPPPAPVSPPAAVPDVLLAKKVEERRLGEAQRLTEQAQRLMAQGQHERAARLLAVSHALDPRPQRLPACGLALRRADLDLEAMAVYLRMEREGSESPSEVAEALSVLRSKTEDADVILPRALRAHLERGRQHFLAGQFAASLEEYALAYLMKPLPRLLFNAAQALRRAGRVEDAYTLYARFLAEEPQTPLRKEAQGYAEELRAVAFRPPLHRRAWFWGVLGAAAAVVVAGSAGLAVSARPSYPMTDTPLQVLSFGLRH